MDWHHSSLQFRMDSRWALRKSSSCSIVRFRKISCSVYAQEKFDLRDCRRPLEAPGPQKYLAMFSETIFVVCLLLRPVKLIDPAFLDNLAVLAV